MLAPWADLFHGNASRRGSTGNAIAAAADSSFELQGRSSSGNDQQARLSSERHGRTAAHRPVRELAGAEPVDFAADREPRSARHRDCAAHRHRRHRKRDEFLEPRASSSFPEAIGTRCMRR